MIRFLFAFSFFVMITGVSAAADCRAPVTYHIANIDPRFGFSDEEVALAAREAAAAWNRIVGEEVVRHSRDGRVAVKLIFSQRQEDYQLAVALRDQGKIIEGGISSFNLRLERLNDQVNDFNEESLSYEEELAEHNNKVLLYNSGRARGNISKRSLDREADRLKRVRDGLADDRLRIERKREKLEGERVKIQRAVHEYNLDQELLRFAMEGQLDFLKSGEYSRRGIDEQIQLFRIADEHELRLVLMHEFGHALGLGHVLDASAVMHSSLNGRNRNRSSLAAADRRAFSALCFD